MSEHDRLRIVPTEENAKPEQESSKEFGPVMRERMVKLGFKFDDKNQITRTPEYLFYVKPNGAKTKAMLLDSDCYWDGDEYILKLSVELNGGGLTPFEVPITNKWLEKYTE